MAKEKKKNNVKPDVKYMYIHAVFCCVFLRFVNALCVLFVSLCHSLLFRAKKFDN